MFTVADGPGSEAALFLAGKSDVCDTVRPQHYALFKQAAAGGRFQFLELGVGAERDFLWFNQNTGTNADGQTLCQSGQAEMVPEQEVPPSRLLRH